MVIGFVTNNAKGEETRSRDSGNAHEISSNLRRPNIYQKYIGKPIQYGIGGYSIDGVLTNVDTREGILSFNPFIKYLVGVPSIVHETAMVRTTPGQPEMIKPLEDGDLEVIVERIREERERQNK